MKRIGDIYGKISSIENCRIAIEKAAQGKKRRDDVTEVIKNKESYAERLQKMLAEQSYKPTPYRIITVKDGLQRKSREIQIPAFFPDQCIHHALMNILSPILEKRMYYWNCGSRKGKGIAHAKKGVERATLHDQKHAKYAVKLDISKCYASVDNDRLIAAFRRIIKDNSALWLITTIIHSCEGLPIGNYTSAWFCNFYLTPIDILVKDEHKIRYFIRYIDDMVFIDSSKRKLRKAVKEVAEYAKSILGLSIHTNWNVFKIRRHGDGKKNRHIDFVGYCFCVGYTTLRKRNALAIMRQSRKIQNRQREGQEISFRAAAGFLSRAGQLTHCKAYGLRQKYVNPINISKLKEVIKSESASQRRAGGRVFS